MVVTDMFSKFARRMSATHDFPYVVIAETPNPIRQLETDALRKRAQAMIETVIDGFTLPPAEIERRLQDVVKEINPPGIARSAVPV
ncbi:MAG TPA: hypothetical protein VJ834_09890 [Burkholderiales bacterium]|nr:hypothetical protein [Burkholderiales bacterium]